MGREEPGRPPVELSRTRLRRLATIEERGCGAPRNTSAAAASRHSTGGRPGSSSTRSIELKLRSGRRNPKASNPSAANRSLEASSGEGFRAGLSSKLRVLREGVAGAPLGECRRRRPPHSGFEARRSRALKLSLSERSSRATSIPPEAHPPPRAGACLRLGNTEAKVDATQGFGGPPVPLAQQAH